MTARQKYDPHLREAAAEIVALLKRYDCVGVMLLVSPTHAEFVNHVEASWSVMKLEPPHGLRFRSKREDYPSKEAQDAATEASVHAITSIIEWSRQLGDNMRGVAMELGKHMRLAWKAWDRPDSTPWDEQ